MKRQLLSVSHSYVVRLNRRLAHEMARVGAGRWEVTAVTPTYFRGTRDLRPVRLQLDQQEPCRVIPVGAYCTGQVHLFWYGTGLRRLLSHPWDLVHCWEEPYVLAGWQVTQSAPPGTPVVLVTAQNWSKAYPPPFNWMERASLRRASAWIAFGRTIHETLGGRPGYGERPSRVIPMGVDVGHFRPDPAAGRAVRRSLGWDEPGPPVVGYLGRFTREKGLGVLMNALGSLKTPWRALFVGAGPMEREIRAWAADRPDAVRVCTAVAHDDVPVHLNAMDVLCAPSQTTPRWREQFGRMLIEGFACGLPVVGSDSGEIPHVLGNSGAVVRESDDAAWAEQIGRLLESRALRQEMGHAGRERAEREFAWSVVAEKHLQFFDEILETQPARGRHAAERVPYLYNAPSSPPPPPRAQPAMKSPKPIRILSLAHSYVVGANRSLAHAIQRAGGDSLKVTIAAPTYFHGQNDLRPVSLALKQSEVCDVVPVSTYLTRSVHLFWYGRRLRRLLHRGWDLIHCWEEPYIVAGAQAAWWAPQHTPFVFRTAQSLPKSYPPPFNVMEDYVVGRCAGWICSGQTVAENLLKRNKYAQRPMARIPLGVDAERFRPDRAAGMEVRTKLGWREPDAPVVGYLGRFVEAKGLTFLMRVLEGMDAPWRALLIGAGPLEGNLAAWAARFPDRVRICSDVRHDDVPAYINAMDVLCAPSQTMPNWREQFGRMLVEAFACGVPVVGSDSGEIPFVIRETGRVAGEKDVDGWRAAIGELFDSPRLRFELGEAGRERALCEYDWSVIGRAHLEFFRSILDGGRPEPAGGRLLAAGSTP